MNETLSAKSAATPSLAASVVQNASSGFLVFLIALPLCLGIAGASGFPPVAGLLTAIVGGLLSSWTGSAPLTIKGPAAGLIVIALGAVTELGMGDATVGYHRALAVGVVAAVIQIVFAVSRAGVFATIMPPAVVHGMLAAIGVIIIAKQTPVALGAVSHGGEPLEMLAHIPSYVMGANPLVAGVGLLALVVLITLNLASRFPLVKKIPAPLLVLLLTVPLAASLHFNHQHDYQMFGGVFSLGPKSLVQLPGSLLSALAFPDFSMITSPISIKYIVMFALVGSVESLLSVLAVDSMDPAKRASNLDKDLLAVGVGNLLASAIGGLPMISEIVRSKANMDAGATNKLSNFFHGLFLLLFVALMPGLLQMIPTAALAAMLLFTGYRLASPKEFIHMWHVGKDQFALFFVTFAVTLATDLLIGVGVGIALKLVMHMVRSHSFAAVFTNKPVVRREGSVMHIKFVGPAVFPSLLRVRKVLNPIPAGLTEVVVDLSECSVVDFTFQEKLFMIADEWEQTKLTITGADAMKASSSHPYASRVRAA